MAIHGWWIALCNLPNRLQQMLARWTCFGHALRYSQVMFILCATTMLAGFVLAEIAMTRKARLLILCARIGYSPPRSR